MDSQNSKPDVGVIHGRFQVLHHDHMKYLLAGKARCSHLIVGITNPDPGLTRSDDADDHRSKPEANPLSYYLRHRMVVAALMESGVKPEEFSVVPFPINFPELYKYYVPEDATFFLTIYDGWGEKKLNMFEDRGYNVEVLWRRPESEKGQCSTHIREMITRNEKWQSLVPASVASLLTETGSDKLIRKVCGN